MHGCARRTGRPRPVPHVRPCMAAVLNLQQIKNKLKLSIVYSKIRNLVEIETM